MLFRSGVMMILMGILQFFEGLAALLKNEVFVVTPKYVVQMNVTTWGWVHLLVGIIVGLAGLGILAGQTWARVVGIILVGFAALVNFTFIPIHPVWSILLIALNVAVIWALCVYSPPELS